jgi:formylmethanofuran dehydrogenase subunit E
MDAAKITEREDFKKCVEFHGHLCPGLTIGYRAASAAMAKLEETRAEDEEMVAVVETDACSADAVQVLTGCTFGKGNFIWRDYGKMVLTLLSRKTGTGVRVSMRPGAFSADPQHFGLMQKVMSKKASESEKEQFWAIHHKRSLGILEIPEDNLFTIETTQMELPPTAKIETSVLCAECGEPTMPSKLEDLEGRKICRGCQNQK